MSPTQNTTPDFLLDQATTRLRDAAVAELPGGLLSATVGAVSDDITLARRVTNTRAMIPKASALVATIAIVVTVVVALVLPDPVRVAFAQVLDNARNADSVAFTLKEGSGNQHKCVVEGTKYRLEHSSGIVIVGDRESRKRLVYDPDNKTAGVFDLNENAAAELGPGMLEQLSQVLPDDAEPVGKETIDGKDVDVFRVNGIKLFGIDSMDSGKGEMRIWVDSKSGLPWRIELRVGSSAIVTLREMTWNVPVESSSFQMQIPDGYVEQPEDGFTARLRPDRPATDRPLTPNEAFRKWSGQDK